MSGSCSTSIPLIYVYVPPKGHHNKTRTAIALGKWPERLFVRLMKSKLSAQEPTTGVQECIEDGRGTQQTKPTAMKLDVETILGIKFVTVIPGPLIV